MTFSILSIRKVSYICRLSDRVPAHCPDRQPVTDFPPLHVRYHRRCVFVRCFCQTVSALKSAACEQETGFVQDRDDLFQIFFGNILSCCDVFLKRCNPRSDVLQDPEAYAEHIFLCRNFHFFSPSFHILAVLKVLSSGMTPVNCFSLPGDFSNGTFNLRNDSIIFPIVFLEI